MAATEPLGMAGLGDSNAEAGKMVRLPKKSIQSEYLLGAQLSLRTFDIALSDLKRVDDPRPPILARQYINRILDDEIRYKMLDKFDEKIAEAKRKGNSQEETSLEIIRISQDFCGEVNSYFDEFFALHKGQVIGEI